MIADERRRKIVTILKSEGTVSTKKLSSMLGVSQMTVRRDLEYLEGRSTIRRHFGGASKNDVDEQPITDFSLRLESEVGEKKQIASRALALIHEGDVIFLDHGTSCAYLARELVRFGNIKVLTHSLPIVNALSKTSIQVICIGGTLHRPNECFIGPLAEEILARFHAPKAFLSTQGIDSQQGLSNGDLFEANMKLLIADRADEVIVLADHTKFSTKGLYPNVPIEKINTVVTDSATSPETIGAYERAGISMLVGG